MVTEQVTCGTIGDEERPHCEEYKAEPEEGVESNERGSGGNGI